MCPYLRLMSATVEGDQPMMEATTARLAPQAHHFPVSSFGHGGGGGGSSLDT